MHVTGPFEAEPTYSNRSLSDAYNTPSDATSLITQSSSASFDYNCKSATTTLET